jgi:hypothetical protein
MARPLHLNATVVSGRPFRGGESVVGAAGDRAARRAVLDRGILTSLAEQMGVPEKAVGHDAESPEGHAAATPATITHGGASSRHLRQFIVPALQRTTASQYAT